MDHILQPSPENRGQNQQQGRGRSLERSGVTGYKDVAKQAVHKEGDVKEAMGPAISMTVVGEKVEFTQVFHF